MASLNKIYKNIPPSIIYNIVNIAQNIYLKFAIYILCDGVALYYISCT